jgi:hypothetical protein
MTTDDFEKRLQRQPLRPIPAEWREEILCAAREATRSAQASGSAQPTSGWRSALSALHSRLSGLLWPSPQAWAGLAAVWLIILAFDLTTSGPSRLVARSASPPSTQFVMALLEEKRLLTELLGPPNQPLAPAESPVREQPKALPPRPRSEGPSALSPA